MRAPFLSVVVPAYNEERTVGELLKRVLATPHEKEVIVVDDGSTDRTPEILRGFRKDPRVRVLRNDRNRGKGASVARALEACRGEVVIIQDADLEYDPADYDGLLGPIVEGRADAVYGTRFHTGPRRALLFWHSVGNWIVTTFSNMLTDLNLTDMETGFKAFRREVVRGMKLRARRFGFEAEITAKLVRAKARIYEVPVSYHGRTYREGKKLTWRDGLAALFWVFRFRLMD